MVKEITTKAGPYEPFFEIARGRKLQWFGHMTHRTGTVGHTIIQETAKETKNTDDQD